MVPSILFLYFGVLFLFILFILGVCTLIKPILLDFTRYVILAFGVDPSYKGKPNELVPFLNPSDSSPIIMLLSFPPEFLKLSY